MSWVHIFWNYFVFDGYTNEHLGGVWYSSLFFDKAGEMWH